MAWKDGNAQANTSDASLHRSVLSRAFLRACFFFSPSRFTAGSELTALLLLLRLCNRDAPRDLRLAGVSPEGDKIFSRCRTMISEREHRRRTPPAKSTADTTDTSVAQGVCHDSPSCTPAWQAAAENNPAQDKTRLAGLHVVG